MTADEIRALLKYSGPPTWRTTVIGILLIAFAGARVYVRPDSIFDVETAALGAIGCGLILGTDKLLGK